MIDKLVHAAPFVIVVIIVIVFFIALASGALVVRYKEDFEE